MSAPSESAATPAPCACTNISLMQLFHELKQKFPGVPDHVVSHTIELYCHDKQACETHLHSEVKASLTHAYHASSVAAARHLNQLKISPPSKCKNQAIVKHDGVKLTPLQSISCQGPQTAVLSSNLASDEDKENKLHTDNNQNILNVNKENITKEISPITEINIDNCYAKYYAESSSDLELTNENLKDLSNEKQNEYISDNGPELNQVQPDLSESTNYKILKSSKVKCNLNEKLEKKTINKSELAHLAQELVHPEKPKRPNTLDFIKPNPDLAFKQTSTENKQPSPIYSPSQKVSSPPVKEAKPSQPTKQEKFPLNFSVNVNCHMDLSRGYSDPWLEDYDSPRAITSVNLTVCTPTSNMASPVRDVREGDEGGFEGHVTVTVSPSTARPPRRRAPAPPPPQTSRIESPRPCRAAPEPPTGIRNDRSLIERQKERLNRLATALSQEQGRLAQLNKERKILSAPPPSPVSAQMLRDDVERLRDMCDSLAKRLESIGSEPADHDSFYSNIYTGQQPPSSWQCHLCTFRNHPLLDTCEGCDMRRIFVGTSPSSTHDSGFGSFRDRNRRGAINPNVDTSPHSNLHEDRRALPIN